MGLSVGSFLNSIIYRLNTGESFLFKRSYCPDCKHQLNWKDLIPLFSFLILRGKCRYCQKIISWQYPLVELATALIFLFLLLEFSVNYTTLYFMLISCFLIIIFVYDLKHYIIPDKIIFSAIIIAFLYQLLRTLDFGFILEFGFWNSDFRTLLNPFLSAILASVFFLTIVLLSRGKWMGIGDIKLAFFMGLFLSYPNIIISLFLAFFLGAIIGVGLILLRKKTLKSEVPFGPFLVTGTFLALFFGKDIINWYLSLILTY